MNVLNCRGCGSIVYESNEYDSPRCCPNYGSTEYLARNIYLELRGLYLRNSNVFISVFFEHYKGNSNAVESNSIAMSQIRIN